MTALRDRFKMSRSWWVAAVLALALLAVLATVALGSSSRACASCHRAQAAQLRKSSHASVGCYSCHLAAGAWSYPGFKAEEMLRMYPSALLGTTQTAPATSLSSAPCLVCHASIMTADKPVEAGGLRILHRACAAGVATCDGCHATTAHGRAVPSPPGPVMDDCIACHARSKAPVSCGTCHAGKLPTDRIKTGVFAVTHGPQWRQTHGLGNLATCEVCHSVVECSDCHKTPVPHPADFGRTHGEFALADRRDCGTCHKQQSFCEGCHGVEMPHPSGFLRKHSKVATSVSDPRCARCHEETDCRRCHAKHVHPGGARGVPVPPRTPSSGGGS